MKDYPEWLALLSFNSIKVQLELKLRLSAKNYK